jgi:DNA-binding PadR family transcriptional regulator
MSRPRYGYEIKKNLIERFSACTTISNNTLYPILKKYENLGAITKSLEIQEGKPNRINYSITDTGKKIFVQSIRNFPDSLAGNRDEFMMRMYFFQFIDIPVREKILELREKFIAEAIKSVKTIQSMDESIFNPESPELNAFHLGLLNSEQALIDCFRKRINEPCLISDFGEIV